MTCSIKIDRAFCALTAFLLLATYPCFAEAASKKHVDKNNKPTHTLIIKDAFVRMPPPNTSSAVVYMNITNESDKTESLVGATSPASEQVELHKIMKSHGVRKMHEVEDIEIPPHTTVPLKLGTYHLMLVGLNKPLELGAVIPLELSFSLAGKVKLSAPVANMGADKNKAGVRK